MKKKISKRSGIAYIPFDKKNALSLADINKLQRDLKDQEFYIVKAHELLDNNKDADGRYDLDDLLIGIEKLQEKADEVDEKAIPQNEAFEVAMQGLKKLADSSDDFVYTKPFYCCDFAQGIINRVNKILNKFMGVQINENT